LLALRVMGASDERIAGLSHRPALTTGKHGLDPRGVALAILCCALWGGNTVAVKFAVVDVPPLACAGIRFLFALPFVVASGWWEGTSFRLHRAYLGPILFNGLFLFAQIATFNQGTSMTLASRASVLINAHPFVVAPLAWVFLGERLNGLGILGLILAAAGVVWLFQDPLQEAGGSLAGDALLLLSAAILGAQTIYQKRVLRTMRGTALLFWQTFVAVPLFFLASACLEGPAIYRVTPVSVAALLYQGLAVSGLCFVVWMYLVHHYPVSQLAAFGFLTPLFGVAAGHLLLGEPLTWNLAGSTALVGLGIYLVARGKPAPEPLVVDDPE
jgi:drug/metabolite transporter (DMT)-like permease